jgi:hypothetical protein
MTNSWLASSARMPDVGTSRRSMSAPVALILVAAVLSTMAACGGSNVRAQTGPPVESTPTVSTTPGTSPPDPTPRQAAATGAVAQVRRYESLLDDLSTHPGVSLNELSSVSTAPDLSEEVGSLNRFREARDRIVGHSRVATVRVDGVSLPSASHGLKGRATVRVSICLNVAQVHAFNHAGSSIVPKSRKPYFLTHLIVVNRTYPKAASWLVSKVTDREVNRCQV